MLFLPVIAFIFCLLNLDNVTSANAPAFKYDDSLSVEANIQYFAQVIDGCAQIASNNHALFWAETVANVHLALYKGLPEELKTWKEWNTIVSTLDKSITRAPFKASSSVILQDVMSLSEYISLFESCRQEMITILASPDNPVTKSSAIIKLIYSPIPLAFNPDLAITVEENLRAYGEAFICFKHSFRGFRNAEYFDAIISAMIVLNEYRQAHELTWLQFTIRLQRTGAFSRTHDLHLISLDAINMDDLFDFIQDSSNRSSLIRQLTSRFKWADRLEMIRHSLEAWKESQSSK